VRLSGERAALLDGSRARLVGIAYRMVGSVDEAEDLVQETYARYLADGAGVAHPQAWLTAVLMRLCIDRLRHATIERAAYTGDWLPEPLVGDVEAFPPGSASEVASDLSMAFLVLLERLGPEERAAFLLREAFGCGYREIARVLGKSPVACRQIAHRARERMAAHRPRFAVPHGAKERLVDRFLAALRAADRDGLLAVLAPEAVCVTDSGGKVRAVRNALRGADRIARLFLGLSRKFEGRHDHRPARVNGEPGVVTSWDDGRVAWTMAVETDGERIVALYRVLNPDKLRRVPAALHGAGEPSRPPAADAGPEAAP
jgi:RNA polymerase sigma-70 factor, ECF subfamily